MPSQIVLTPGSLSPFAPDKPPSLATRRTTSLSVGGLSGNICLFSMYWTVLGFPRPPFGCPPVAHHIGGTHQLIS